MGNTTIRPADVLLEGTMHWSQWLDPDTFPDWDVNAKLVIQAALTGAADLENWRAFSPGTIQFLGRLESLARIGLDYCQQMSISDPDVQKRQRWAALKDSFIPELPKRIKDQGVFWLCEKVFLSSEGGGGSLMCTPKQSLIDMLSAYVKVFRACRTA